MDWSFLPAIAAPVPHYVPVQLLVAATDWMQEIGRSANNCGFAELATVSEIRHGNI